MNPVIAVLLGWLILSEPVTARTFLAMSLILGAVIWIQLSHKLRRAVGLADRRTESATTVSPSDGPTVRQAKEVST